MILNHYKGVPQMDVVHCPYNYGGISYDLQKARKRTIGSLDVFLSHLKPFGKLVMGIKVK